MATELMRNLQNQLRTAYAELYTTFSERHASNYPAFSVHRYTRNPDGTHTRDADPSMFDECFLYPVNSTTTGPALAYGPPASGKTSTIQDFMMYAGVPMDAIRAATLSGHEELNVPSALHEIVTTKSRTTSGLPKRFLEMLRGAKVDEVERVAAIAKQIGRLQIYEEAGRLPRASQEYLLRAFEEGVFETPWGGGEPYIVEQPRRLYLTTNTGIASLIEKGQFTPAFLDRVGMSIPHSSVHSPDGTRRIIRQADRKLAGEDARGYLTFDKVPAAREFLNGKRVNGHTIDVGAIPKEEEPLYVMLAARMAGAEMPLSEDANNFIMYAPAVLSVCHRGGEGLIGEKTLNDRGIPDRCTGCPHNVNNTSICQYNAHALSPRLSRDLKQGTQGAAMILDQPQEGTLDIAVELFPYNAAHRLSVTPLMADNYHGDRLRYIRAIGGATRQVVDHMSGRGALEAVEDAVYNGRNVPLPSSMVEGRGADRVIAAQSKLAATYLLDPLVNDASKEAFRRLWESIDGIQNADDLRAFRRAVSGFPVAGMPNGASLHPYSKQRLLSTAEEEAERKGIA